jgi:hypothetical protein
MARRLLRLRRLCGTMPLLQCTTGRMPESPLSDTLAEVPSRPSAPRFRRTALRWGVAAMVLAGIYALAGFAIAPALIKSRLPEFAEKQLKRKASIGEVKINPFTLRIEARDFKLAEADGRPIAGFAALVADLEWSSLPKRAWTLAEVRLTEPSLLLDIAPDGRINLADLIDDLTRDAPKEKNAELPRLKIASVAIERGRADFSDRRAGYRNALAPIDINLENFSTLREEKGPYMFRANTAKGGVLRWQGDLSMNPIVASGRIHGEALSLPDLDAYLKPWTTADITEGTLGFEMPYRVAYRDGRLQASVAGAALGVNALAVKAAGAVEPFLSLASLKVDKLDADYGKREIAVGLVALDRGKLAVKRDAKGNLDVLGLIKPPLAAVPAGAAVSAGTAVTPAPAEVAAWKARVAQASLDNFALAYEDRTAATPLTAAIERFSVKAALGVETGAVTRLTVDGVETGLHNLVIGAKAAPPLRIGDITLTGGELDLAARSVKAARISISDGQIRLVRDKLGRINLLDLLPGVAPGAATAPGSSTDTPWKALVGAVLVAKVMVDAEDQESGIALRAQDIGVKLADVSGDPKQPLKFEAGLSLREGGKISVQGRAVPAQGALDANLKVDQLALKPVQPLLARYVKLKLEGGVVSAQGKVAVARAGGKAPLLRYTGDFNVADLKLDEDNGELFAAWKSVGADQLNLTLQPNRLEVPELRIVEPNAKLLINADRSLNAMRLLVNPPAAASGGATVNAAPVAPAIPASPATASVDAEPFPVLVRRVRVQNGKLDFADLSLRPQFGAKIHELNGVINGLATDKATRSQLELDGRVDEFGLARIRGELNPFSPRDNTDVSIVFRNVDLTSASPYSMKFAGYKIASGKISLDLNYKVRASRLEGQNKVVLDQLTLGERVDSPDALNLPLELAIAILKDSDGKIDLDLPVSGSLDDPQFSYGAVVWKAITTVIGKIVSAPFRALGALFGISGEKLEAVEFDPGSAVLLPPEREKLKQVATVLSKRAQLKIAVPSSYNETVDSAALRVRALRLETALRAGLRVAEGEEPGPPDLQDGATRTALRTLLTERHGAGEWDKRKVDAEAGAAGKPISMLERATRLTQGEPQVADLAPLYRGIVERLHQSQPLPADALTQLAKRRSDIVAEALKGAGVDAARISQPAPEAVEAPPGSTVLLKLGLASR